MDKELEEQRLTRVEGAYWAMYAAAKHYYTIQRGGVTFVKDEDLPPVFAITKKAVEALDEEAEVAPEIPHERN